MIAVYAIKDLAKKAGINQFSIDWNSSDDYFLPSGYTFTAPAVKFEANRTILDCIVELAQRFTAYVYFDENGQFHINYLPGGMLSNVVPSSVAASFVTDPSSTGIIVLGSKTIDVTLDDTLNHMTATTVDRNNLNIIVEGKNATRDYLLFDKGAFMDQAAFGGQVELKTYMNDLAARVFKPIRKTSFKTVGDGTIIHPLDFITLDGVLFRLISVKRTYSAENNDFS
jgi:hypothetical protein